LTRQRQQGRNRTGQHGFGEDFPVYAPRPRAMRPANLVTGRSLRDPKCNRLVGQIGLLMSILTHESHRRGSQG
jgi:hypothetical protein